MWNWLVQLVWYSCKVSGHIGTYLDELTSMSILTVCILDQRSQTIHAEVSGIGEHRRGGGNMVINITTLDWFSNSLLRAYGQKRNPFIACFHRAMHLCFIPLITTVSCVITWLMLVSLFWSTSFIRARLLYVLHTTWHIVMIVEGRQERGERGNRR